MCNMQGRLKTFKTVSQCSKILAYLQLGNTLTVSQARELDFGDNLRSRVSNLHDAGHNVISKRQDTNTGFIAVYAIPEYVNLRAEIEELAEMDFDKIHTIHKNEKTWHLKNELDLKEILRLLNNGFTAMTY